MSTVPDQEFRSRLEREAQAKLRVLSEVVRRAVEQNVTVSTSTQEPADATPAQNTPATAAISWGAYLRTVWSVLWTAFRHPWSTTIIDARTGKVLRT